MDQLTIVTVFSLGFLAVVAILALGLSWKREYRYAKMLESILAENQSLRDQLASAVSADAEWLRFRRDTDKQRIEQATVRAAMEPPQDAPLEVERPFEVPMPPHGGV